jgi:osmotically-inducible protein OsmY
MAYRRAGSRARDWLLLAAGVTALSGCAIAPGAGEVLDPADTRGRTGAYLDDSLITTRAKAALVSAGVMAPLRFNVETRRGVVQLSGYSSSRDEMENVVAAVRGVPGVRAVRNDIRVRD